MTFSKIKVFSFLALSYSLIACGQTQASTAPNTTPNAIAQTTASPAIIEKSPEPQSVETAIAQSTVDAESLYKAFEEIDQQTCDDRKSIVQRGINYSACTANAGGKGQYRFISASSSLVSYGDGIGYWYYLNGKVAAIRFFHTDELFMFDGGGKLQAELIRAQKVMVNGQEQFQERSIRTNFTKSERDRLENLAKDGGEDILSKFKQSTPQVKNGTDVCSGVIANVKDAVETIPDVKLTSNSRFSELSIPYPDRSANLNRQYTLAISGDGVTDFWKSGDAVRNEIAKQIIENCEGMAAVTFGRDRSGESVTIGIFPNGSIKQFTCAERSDSRPRTPPLTWGQQDCDF